MSDAPTWHWLAVFALVTVVTVIMTLVWLDSPTERERQIEERREQQIQSGAGMRGR